MEINSRRVGQIWGEVVKQGVELICTHESSRIYFYFILFLISYFLLLLVWDQMILASFILIYMLLREIIACFEEPHSYLCLLIVYLFIYLLCLKNIVYISFICSNFGLVSPGVFVILAQVLDFL